MSGFDMMHQICYVRMLICWFPQFPLEKLKCNLYGFLTVTYGVTESSNEALDIDVAQPWKWPLVPCLTNNPKAKWLTWMIAFVLTRKWFNVHASDVWKVQITTLVFSGNEQRKTSSSNDWPALRQTEARRGSHIILSQSTMTCRNGITRPITTATKWHNNSYTEDWFTHPHQEQYKVLRHGPAGIEYHLNFWS